MAAVRNGQPAVSASWGCGRDGGAARNRCRKGGGLAGDVGVDVAHWAALKSLSCGVDVDDASACL
jgi:hypothetical protein